MASSKKFLCRLCGADVVARPWGGGECASCESVSMPTLPSNQRIAAFYSTYNDNYKGGGGSDGRNLARYARRYLQLVQQFATGGTRLIDVGSSNSPFPNLAASAGFEAAVLDFSRPGGLNDSVRFIAGSINDRNVLQAHAGAFDIVTSWAVLEHVPNPQLAARVLAGLCRPGGALLLSTPEIGTALTRHSLGHSPWFYPPEHLCLVSPEAIRLLFEPLGFTIAHCGRLELTTLRFAARYGIGAAEAAVGRVVRTAAPRHWQVLRDARTQAFSGVTFVALRKSPTVAPPAVSVRQAEAA